MIFSFSDSPLFIDNTKHSIFLAGPTPRSRDVASWRPTAVTLLVELGYQGQVIIPERSVKADHVDYDLQVEWENKGLTECKSIVFWVPRNLRTMPAFTTNVEFGRFAHDTRSFYGRPDDSEKNRYLDWLYKKVNNKPICNNLKDLLQAAIWD